MKSKLSNLQRRLAALEGIQGGDVIFTLIDNTRAGIRPKRLLESLLDAIDKRDTPGARIMLRAKRASDGSRLHEVAQALRAGPVPPGQVNPGLDDDSPAQWVAGLTDGDIERVAGRLEAAH